MKGKTAIDLASTEMTMTLLCPLHYCAAKGMLDNLVSEIAKVARQYCFVVIIFRLLFLISVREVVDVFCGRF